MSKSESLLDVYVEELKDLWSANDQMARALRKISPSATNEKLRQLLEKAPGGIESHTALLKALIDNQGDEVSKEHCRGMEGLVKEALKHTVEEGPSEGPLLDVLIVAQFQRMTHYGITGFGTAAAIAKAIGLDDDVKQLSDAVSDMHDADDLMSEIAENAVNREAARE